MILQGFLGVGYPAVTGVGSGKHAYTVTKVGHLCSIKTKKGLESWLRG